VRHYTTALETVAACRAGLRIRKDEVVGSIPTTSLPASCVPVFPVCMPRFTAVGCAREQVAASLGRFVGIFLGEGISQLSGLLERLLCAGLLWGYIHSGGCFDSLDVD